MLVLAPKAFRAQLVQNLICLLSHILPWNSKPVIPQIMTTPSNLFLALWEQHKVPFDLQLTELADNISHYILNFFQDSSPTVETRTKEPVVIRTLRQNFIF